MLLLPRMLQSIEILQLPVVELETYLLEAAESNEALSVESPELPGEAPPPRSRAESDAYDEWLRNQPGPPKGLHERVEEQLSTAELAPLEREWVRLLIACLDSAGYLSMDDDALLQHARERGLEGDAGDLGGAIAALQGLEPRGIGARDAVEALLLQLDPSGEDYPSLCELLEEHLDELARNKLPGVARAMGIEIAELARLIDALRELDPRPVAGLIEEDVPALLPDVVVEWTGDGYEVRLASGALPTVRIDPDVGALAKDPRLAPPERRYLRGKLDQARWIVDAVEQRRQTILRVATAVFEHQRPFLDQGPGHLRPLRMGEVAERLGIHVSTVSRAVAGKHAQTPFGVFPLRDFFQAPTGADGSAARDEVRESVRRIVAAEDAARPLSDDEIVALLGGQGIELARRTVTKYRGELGIPSSYRRKRHRG